MADMDDKYSRVTGQGLVDQQQEVMQKFQRPDSILDKVTKFANSWYGWGIAVLVSLGPTLLGWWAYQVEDEAFCIVNDEATLEEMIACSTTGKFNRLAAECAKVLIEDGTDVTFWFNTAIAIYMAGFVGFTMTLLATKAVKEMIAGIGSFIACFGILSIISVFLMLDFRFFNEAGAFCSGVYAEDDSLAPLHYKGHFIKDYLILFGIGVGTLIIGMIFLCTYVYKAMRNRPGAALIQNSQVPA